MDDHRRRIFRIWAAREEHKQLVSSTLDRMRQLIEGHRCVVCFSGGKDSTVMLHLAIQIDPGIDVFNWDQGSWLMPRDIQAEVLANARSLGAMQLVVESAPVQEDERIRTCPERWRSSHLQHYLALNRVRRERGWQVQFVGLRKEEGCRRSAVIREHRRRGEDYPLEDWRWLDVWAYIVSHGLPYPRVYDKYAPLLGWDQARFVNFFSIRFENFGSPYVDGFLLPEKRNLRQAMQLSTRRLARCIAFEPKK